MGFAKGVPARFEPASQHRRALLGKTEVARKELAMAEDDFRQGLIDATGKTSRAQCTEAELVRFIDWLKSKGFQQLPHKRAAGHPAGRKARALWISLYHLNAVHNPDEAALEAFAKRQLGCERLVWARQSDAFRLIEALKAWGEREGWRQTDVKGKPAGVALLQIQLCQAIVDKLKAAGLARPEWRVDDCAWKLCGIAFEATGGAFTVQHYARVAKALGEFLRKHTGGRNGSAD